MEERAGRQLGGLAGSGPICRLQWPEHLCKWRKSMVRGKLILHKEKEGGWEGGILWQLREGPKS